MSQQARNNPDKPGMSPANAAQGHSPLHLVVKKQYRSETIMQPQYWDVCTRREDGPDTIFETVAENCSEQDAHAIAEAVNSLAALKADNAILENNCAVASENEARLRASNEALASALETIHSNAAESVEWIRRTAGSALARAKGGKP